MEKKTGGGDYETGHSGTDAGIGPSGDRGGWNSLHRFDGAGSGWDCPDCSGTVAEAARKVPGGSAVRRGK